MTDTTVSDTAAGVHADALRAAYRPAFPPAWAVPVAAGTLWDAADAARPARAPRAVQDGIWTVGHVPGVEAPEGPSWFVSVAPGRIRIGHCDHARRQRADERAVVRRRNRVREGAAYLAGSSPGAAAVRAMHAAGLLAGELPDGCGDPGPVDPLRPGRRRARITEWSAKSRRTMLERFSTFDYEPMVAQGVPAMVTLTLPCGHDGCRRCVGRDRSAACTGWLTYAPDGDAFKGLVRALRERYFRAWGVRVVGLWKLEFQDRGAPHMHVLMVPPTGRSADGLLWREWVARAWAGVLRVEGDVRARVIAVHEHRKASADYAEGLRASDPKRVAAYFLKHSLLRNKEYQHRVPAQWQDVGPDAGEGGPGRFWGYWGLRRADRAVPVTDAQAVTLARTLRRWARAGRRLERQDTDHAGRPVTVPYVERPVRRADVWRVNRATGAARRRSVIRRTAPMRGTAGFLLVNDGPGVALMLAGRLRA